MKINFIIEIWGQNSFTVSIPSSYRTKIKKTDLAQISFQVTSTCTNKWQWPRICQRLKQQTCLESLKQLKDTIYLNFPLFSLLFWNDYMLENFFLGYNSVELCGRSKIWNSEKLANKQEIDTSSAELTSQSAERSGVNLVKKLSIVANDWFSFLSHSIYRMQILLLLVLIQSIFSYHALTQPYGGMIFLPFFHLFLTGESQTYGSNSDILQTYSPEHKGPKIKEKKKKKKKTHFFPCIWISKLQQSFYFWCKITSHLSWTNISQSTKGKSHNILIWMIEISAHRLRSHNTVWIFFFFPFSCINTTSAKKLQ